MNTQIQKTILAGIIGTAIMTVVMMLASVVGMPKMSPPAMLAGMLSVSVVVGWVMHFVIGILFAFGYQYLNVLRQKVSNVWIRGAIFGVIAFLFAQIMMGIMGAMLPMPKMEGSMVLTMVGSLLGHIVFGIAVVKTMENRNEN